MAPSELVDTLSARRYADHIADQRRVVWCEDVPWAAEGRVLSPLAMPHSMHTIDRRCVRAALHELGSSLALWNDAWDTGETQWWWICASGQDYRVESFSKRGRRDVRAGLRRCEVRRIDADFLADQGYPVYRAAFEGYRNPGSPLASDDFAQQVLRTAGYPGREFWGAFDGEALMAFAGCNVIDHAVSLNWLKADPTQRTKLPNNALVYTLTEHYLCDRHFLYVTTGHRPMSHDTQMEGFLRRMGYRRVYCPLRIEWSRPTRFLLASRVPRLARWGIAERLAPGACASLRTVERLVRIAE